MSGPLSVTMVIDKLNQQVLKEEKYRCFVELRNFPNVSMADVNGCSVSVQSMCACIYVWWGLVVKWFGSWAHDPWVMGLSPTTRPFFFPCLPPPPPVHPAVNGYLV